MQIEIFLVKIKYFCEAGVRELEIISCPLDYLLNPKNPTPPKLRFVSPPRKRGGDWGASVLGGSADLFAQRLPLGEASGVWGAMTVGIITNYADMILLLGLDFG